MDLESKCRELREWIKSEQDYWRERKQRAIDDEYRDGAVSANARICDLANVLRKMDNLGMAVEK